MELSRTMKYRMAKRVAVSKKYLRSWTAREAFWPRIWMKCWQVCLKRQIPRRSKLSNFSIRLQWTFYSCGGRDSIKTCLWLGTSVFWKRMAPQIVSQEVKTKSKVSVGLGGFPTLARWPSLPAAAKRCKDFLAQLKTTRSHFCCRITIIRTIWGSG